MQSLEVFANNTTLTMLTYLTYMSTLYLKLERLLVVQWRIQDSPEEGAPTL